MARTVFQGLAMRIVHKDERGVRMWQTQDKKKKTLVSTSLAKARENAALGAQVLLWLAIAGVTSKAQLKSANEMMLA